MKLDSPIRIAVLSDLHAHDKLKEAPSLVNIGIGTRTVSEDPLKGLAQFIERSGMKADLLLCPGDLGHQACPASISAVWAEIHELGKSLGTTLTTATAGNHDIDSRYIGNNFSPEHILKKLAPPYPLARREKNDEYWGRAYTIEHAPNRSWRLVILNSSAYHGKGEWEQNHGRIDELTLEQLTDDLAHSPECSANILLCHHHPISHSELGLGEADLMRNGQLLLDALGSGDYGDWLLIHGHKHHAKLAYAGGPTSDTPVVFAAGSLSALPWLGTSGRTANQFYMITVGKATESGYGLIGRVESWDWSIGLGWTPAISADRSGLPHECGFGFRNPKSLVKPIVDLFEARAEQIITWQSVLAAAPALEFLLPGDFARLEKSLIKQHKLKIVLDSGQPHQIERIPG